MSSYSWRPAYPHREAHASDHPAWRILVNVNRLSTIYLHIGLHKTGTSTLQEFLYQHRSELLRHTGVYLPGLQPNLSHPLSSLFHDNPAAYPLNVMHGIDSEEKVAARNVEIQQQFDAEFSTCTADSMLMSGEDMCLLSYDALRRMTDWLDPRCEQLIVACVLRDPTGWSTSAAQSRIRGGETLHEVNEDHRVQRLQPLLETIAGAFGYERMRWLDFHQLTHHPDNYIVGFLDALGLESNWARNAGVAVVNESISMEAARIVSAINTARPLYIDGKLNPERWPNDIDPICRSVTGQRFRLRDDTLERIRAAEGPMLDWLSDEFGFRFQGVMTRPESLSPPAETEMSDAEITDLALQMHDRERDRAG